MKRIVLLMTESEAAYLEVSAEFSADAANGDTKPSPLSSGQPFGAFTEGVYKKVKAAVAAAEEV